ncbi:MAG TPA: translation elongation factor Ts [Candidatus Paceibacterota bacterium]|nr:translation elongation factor Ts [Candidatus Paceibacterota bacterium]
MIAAELVRKLREKTGASMMDCKKSLEDVGGDEAKALKILQEKNKLTAMKKSKRNAEQGIIEAYVHSNAKVGVLLELKCETDFVARNSEFRELAHNIAMHIAGMDSKDEESLLEEPFVKDQEITLKSLIENKIAKLGENIKISRFTRFEL